MARGPCTFKQQDVTRALKAAAAGIGVQRFEIDKDGTIRRRPPAGLKHPAKRCQKRGWQGQQDSNLRPTVLETVALPTELYP